MGETAESTPSSVACSPVPHSIIQQESSQPYNILRILSLAKHAAGVMAWPRFQNVKQLVRRKAKYHSPQHGLVARNPCYVPGTLHNMLMLETAGRRMATFLLQPHHILTPQLVEHSFSCPPPEINHFVFERSSLCFELSKRARYHTHV